MGAPACWARLLSSANRAAGVPTQWRPACFASPLVGPCDCRRFHMTIRLVAVKWMRHLLPKSVTVPPWPIVPMNRVGTFSPGASGAVGKYCWCSWAMVPRIRSHAPMLSGSMSHVGSALSCTSTREPDNVTALPAKSPARSIRSNVSTAGSGWLTGSSAPHEIVKSSNAAMSCRWSLTGFHPSPVSKYMNGCCAISVAHPRNRLGVCGWPWRCRPGPPRCRRCEPRSC